jgi:hypothetical protein
MAACAFWTLLAAKYTFAFFCKSTCVMLNYMQKLYS